MTTYRVEPSVSGELGEDTVIDSSTWPPTIERFQFDFDGWYGEDIAKTFPTFLVTRRLRLAMEQAGVTGVVFGYVDARKGEQFDIMMRGQHVDLPQWDRMDVTGVPGVDDAWLGERFRLIVNERLMTLLREFNLTGAEVFELEDE